MRLIETVPNLSEGRRADVVADIAHALSGGDGAWLLDVHRDPTHHRSVVTAALREETALARVLRFADEAVARIDLQKHDGAHPRMGALDVLPFVPLGSTTMLAAVELARAAASQLAARFDIPVFLYGRASRNAPPPSLHHFRRGGLSKLAKRLARGELVPDFGPPRLHETAGAVAVGARDFLIAYNVWLRTSDVRVAKAIASSIRESSGGLDAVQAIGVSLPRHERVQVSTNLLAHETTGLQQVFDAIRREADRRNVPIDRSELVGLVPRAATFENMTTTLRLESPPGILEARLEEAGLSGAV